MTTRREAYRERITPEAVEAWRRVRAGDDRYFSCIRGAPCDSIDGRHCAACRTYLEALVALEAALGLPPWQEVEDDVELVAALDSALDEQEGNR